MSQRIAANLLARQSLPSLTLRNIVFLRLRSLTPPLKVKWYHNTDVPLSKPEWYEYKPEKDAEKFSRFSDYDNSRLERAYAKKTTTVEVKEDRLFEVNLDKMEMAPVYWPGPVYEVRRGTWFTCEGTPLLRELADKVEKAYLKVKKYEDELASTEDSLLDGTPKALIEKFNQHVEENFLTESVTIAEEDDMVDLGGDEAVIFFDETYGAIVPNELSPIQVNSLRTLKPRGGSLLSVTPIRRGYEEGMDASIMDNVKASKVASLPEIFLNEVLSLFSKDDAPSMSNEEKKPDQDQLLEEVLETDYENDKKEAGSRREIKHLVFCIHGIGQNLGMKYESVNFTHSINVLRKTMRDVYKNEEKYRHLAHGESFDPADEVQEVNNTIQVLPISWRHLVSFQPEKPFSLTNDTGEEKFPSLSQLNVDGVKPLRNMVGDVILDVLLYYEPRYIEEIMKAVVSEISRVYKLFLERNPDFDGKVHVFGHSLGSAIAFDLLCQQRLNDATEKSDYQLDFDVENFFCVGSPVGMFKLLQQKNIRGRAGLSDSDYEEVAAPKCNNLYNVFHPCDPVAYRMEPLVNPKYAQMKAEEVPFALRGFNTQVQELSSIGDGIQEKLFSTSNWFKKSEPKEVAEEKKSAWFKKKRKLAKDENALGDIISTLTSTKGQKDVSQKGTVVEFDHEELEDLLKLNRTGRIDYSLPMGVFSIALVSAISAHVSYFEDEETAGFVMKEILSSGNEPVDSRKVTLYKQ